MASTVNYSTNLLKKLVILLGVAGGAILGIPALAQTTSPQVNIIDPLSNKSPSNLGVQGVSNTANPLTTAPRLSPAPITTAPAPSAAPTIGAAVTTAPLPSAAPTIITPAPSAVPTTTAPVPSAVPTTIAPTPSTSTTAATTNVITSPVVNKLTLTNPRVTTPSAGITTIIPTNAATEPNTAAPSLAPTPTGVIRPLNSVIITP